MNDTPTTVSISAQVGWRVVRDEGTKDYVGICDSMNLTTFGSSLDELASMINEVMQEMLLDLLRTGHLATFLRNRGWIASVPPQQLPINQPVHFNLPFDLLMGSSASGVNAPA